MVAYATGSLIVVRFEGSPREGLGKGNRSSIAELRIVTWTAVKEAMPEATRLGY